MRIKSDFVTNSSSACYIMSLPPDEVPQFEEYVAKLNENPNYQNEGVGIYRVFYNLQELQDWTNGRPYDWASKPMGGLRFHNLDKELYLKIKEVVDEEHVAVYCAVDYQACDEFERSKYIDMVAEELS